jgi:hypothetical protein
MKERVPGEKKKLFNLFDVILIGLVGIALAVVLITRLTSAESAVSVVETTKVRYMVELTDLIPGTAALVKPGDKLVEAEKKYEVGTVVSCESGPTIKLGKNLETGDYVLSEMPGYETAYILIEADCPVSETSFIAGGGFRVCGGVQVMLRGPGYYGGGYILYVERGDGQ